MIARIRQVNIYLLFVLSDILLWLPLLEREVLFSFTWLMASIKAV
jgi:hypothetical protein